MSDSNRKVGNEQYKALGDGLTAIIGHQANESMGTPHPVVIVDSSGSIVYKYVSLKGGGQVDG